jgi:hypothetical protein
MRHRIEGQALLPSRPHVAMGLGPYLHLKCRSEVAGVWPLRIPDTGTAASGSSAA